MIEARQDLGAFVVQPDMRRTIRIDAEEFPERDNAINLFELCATLETEAADLASCVLLIGPSKTHGAVSLS